MLRAVDWRMRVVERWRAHGEKARGATQLNGLRVEALRRWLATWCGTACGVRAISVLSRNRAKLDSAFWPKLCRAAAASSSLPPAGPSKARSRLPARRSVPRACLPECGPSLRARTLRPGCSAACLAARAGALARVSSCQACVPPRRRRAICLPHRASVRTGQPNRDKVCHAGTQLLPLRRRHSNSTIPAATETLSDAMAPAIGIRTSASQCCFTS